MLLISGIEVEQLVVDDCAAYAAAELLSEIVWLYRGACYCAIYVVRGD
ncbi:MAG TPA: hypothetical protein VIX90_01390 [Edaphobacter sp.]